MTLSEVDATLEEISALSGSGSQARRTTAVADLFGRADRAGAGLPAQPDHRRGPAGRARLGDARGDRGRRRAAADGRAPGRDVRAPTGPIAVAALTGGEAALAAFRCWSAGRCGRCSPPRRPTSPAAWQKVGRATVAVDTKLDGIRIQVHKHGDEVARLHPQPRRDHRPAARGRRGRPLAAGDRPDPRRRGARARRRRAAAARSRRPRRAPPTPRRRDRRSAVLLRPAARRRRRPDRRARLASGSRGSTRPCPSELPRPRLVTSVRRRGAGVLRPTRSPPATRA